MSHLEPAPAVAQVVADPARPYKAVVAILGAAITACLGLIPAGSTLFVVLTILSAALTAGAVYLVPNPKVVKTGVSE